MRRRGITNDSKSMLGGIMPFCRFIIAPLFLGALLFLGGCANPLADTELKEPSAPAAPSLAAGNAQITASWTEVDGATAYEVWYGTESDSASAGKFGDDVGGTSAAITGLSNGTTYHVWIKAKNSAGTGGFSASASATPAETMFEITVEELANGTVSVQPETAIAGTTITITVTPDDYFAINGVPVVGDCTVTAEAGHNEFTFEMPGTDVTVSIPALKAQDGYIIIASADDFAKIGTAGETDFPLDGKYVLVNDLVLEDWTPVGSVTAPFTGSFYGNGKTLTLASFALGVAITNRIGIFGHIQGADTANRAMVEKLNLQNALSDITLTVNNTRLGILAGSVKWTDITGITGDGLDLKIAFTGIQNIAAGTVVGYLEESELDNAVSSVSIRGVASGNANGYPYFGLVGYVKSGTIQNSRNSGGITLTGTMLEAGGIAGLLNAGTILKCSATGDISITGGTFNLYVGGICARAIAVSTIEKCFYTGTIYGQTSTTSQTAAGGIAGTLRSVETGNGSGGVTIKDCYTTGDVTLVNGNSGTASTAIYTMAGGIAGFLYQGPHTISGCYATGNVKVQGQKRINVGGIAGNSAAAQIIKNCVALNASLKYETADSSYCDAYRIANAASFTENCAWSDMPLTSKIGEGDETPIDPAPNGWNTAHGQGINSNKPDKTSYETIGWDFTQVWEMSGGYPVLR